MHFKTSPPQQKFESGWRERCRVDFDSPQAVTAWASEFGVSEVDLWIAARIIGNRAIDLGEYFGMRVKE